MLLDLLTKYTKDKSKTDEQETTFLTLDNYNVVPSFLELQDEFYFKPNRPLVIHLTYYEFIDYVFTYYRDFLNKILLKEFDNHTLDYEDLRLMSLRTIYSNYLKEPKSYKSPMYFIHSLIEQDNSNPNVDKFKIYEGPCPVVMCLLSNKKVFDKNDVLLSLDNFVESFNKQFLSKWDNQYEILLNNYPIVNKSKLDCLNWLMEEGYDLAYYISFSFKGSDEIGWVCCERLLNEGFDFRNFINPNEESYVIGRVTVLSEVYNKDMSRYFKYSDVHSQVILEELLYNGYDTSTLDPNVVDKEDLKLIPLCLQMNIPFLKIYNSCKDDCLKVMCLVKLGFSLDKIISYNFDLDELIKDYSLTYYGEYLGLDDLVNKLCIENIRNYKVYVDVETNDLFLNNLKNIE